MEIKLHVLRRHQPAAGVTAASRSAATAAAARLEFRDPIVKGGDGGAVGLALERG
ncbi:MAG: hypothetical protein LIQ30_11715 [Planctomycetes bacterium]|nr:hypothetical protein [Planctomycetota bacterium]